MEEKEDAEIEKEQQQQPQVAETGTQKTQQISVEAKSSSNNQKSQLHPQDFVEINENIFRSTFYWPFPVVPDVPVATFLVNQASTVFKFDFRGYLFQIRNGAVWTLIDAGLKENAKALIEKIKACIKDGNLKQVALTHGHLDHVILKNVSEKNSQYLIQTGALEELIKEYPEIRVRCHKEESPFVEGRKYRTCVSDNFAFKIGTVVLKESNVKVDATFVSRRRN